MPVLHKISEIVPGIFVICSQSLRKTGNAPLTYWSTACCYSALHAGDITPFRENGACGQTAQQREGNLCTLHNVYSEKFWGMTVIWRKRRLTSLEDFAKIHPSFLKRREAATMTKTMNRKMNKTMTAACAGAASCCACAASHTVILSVLGAMIMASIIIICALVLLVLAAFPYAPLARITA